MKAFFVLLFLFIGSFSYSQQYLGAFIANLASRQNQKNKIFPLHEVLDEQPISKEEKKVLFSEVKELNKYIFKNSDSAYLYIQRGLIYKKLGVAHEALKDFEQALQHKTSEPKIRFYLGECHFLIGNTKSAIHYFDQFSQQNPNDPTPQFYKGLVRMYHQKSRFHSIKERFEESIPEFSRTLEIDPDHQKALFLRGYAQHYLDNFEEALNDYTNILEKNPKNPSLHILIGEAYVELKKPENACEHFQEAKNLGFPMADKYIKKGCPE